MTQTAQTELFLIAAQDPQALLAKLAELAAAATTQPIAQLSRLFYKPASDGDVRLALVAGTQEELSARVKKAEKLISKKPGRAHTLPNGSISYDPSPDKEPKVAFLFPGQGTQYVGMLAELIDALPNLKTLFDQLDQRAIASGLTPPSTVVWPTGALTSDQHAYLQDLSGGGQSVIIAGIALARLYRRLGVPCSALMGHSNGELAALIAGDILVPPPGGDLFDVLGTVAPSFKDIDQANHASIGQPVAVIATDRPAVNAVMSDFAEAHYLMLDNCPRQLVLFIKQGAHDQMIAALKATGALTVAAPFPTAYHTPLLEPFQATLLQYYHNAYWQKPAAPIYSAATMARFPDTPEEMAQTANIQWSKTVRFGDTLKKLYADGIHLFIDAGPGGRLAGFVRDTFGKQRHAAIAADQEGRAGLELFLSGLGRLFCAGVNIDLQQLAQERLATYDEPSHPQPIATQSTPPQPASSPTPSALTAKAAIAQEHFALMRDFLDQQTRMAAVMMSRGADNVPATPAAPISAVPVPSPPPPMAEPQCTWPFEILEQGPKRMVARLQVTDRDRFVDHHRLSRPAPGAHPSAVGLPVVPFAMSIEIAGLAATTLLNDPKQVVQAIDDIRGHRWLALDHGVLDLLVTAELMSDGRIKILLSDQTDGTPKPAFEATVEVTVGYPTPPKAQQAAGLALENVRFHAEEYTTQWLFHGDHYQLLRKLHGWSADGMSVELCQPDGDWLGREKPAPARTTLANLLDAAGQLPAYWYAHIEFGCFSSFPFRFGRIELFAPAPEPGTSITGHLRAKAPMGAIVGDLDLTNTDGALLARIKGAATRVFEVPYSLLALFRGFGDRPSMLRPVSVGPHHVFILDEWPRDVLEQGDAIWQRALAHAVLQPDERAEWYRLAASPDQRFAWMLSRVAEKEAIRISRLATDGHAPDISQIRIDDPAAPLIATSVTRNDHVAVLVTPNAIRAGITLGDATTAPEEAVREAAKITQPSEVSVSSPVQSQPDGSFVVTTSTQQITVHHAVLETHTLAVAVTSAPAQTHQRLMTGTS